MKLFRGIRFQLGVAALALLVLPFLAAQFIIAMETFLRGQQEASIVATARTVAAAFSDRPALFGRAQPEDPDLEERRRIIALFAAADPDAAASLGNAYAPSDEIERLLKIVVRRSAQRLTVIDARARVRGLAGTLREPPGERALRSWVRPIAALLVPTPRVPAGDLTRPEFALLDRALNGVVSTSWRGTVERDRAVLSAAQPVFVGDDIVGAVLVEETTSPIQLLKQSALERLLATTLLVTGAALVLLLIFASRLATRVRALHRQADAAIDAQGRITGAIVASSSADELGDLSRTMAAVLTRLRDYNAYLEAMAGRLSHELRTPVAVVRSSLDNLKAESLPDSARVYVDRADQGVQRLASLISRLSEATRLERLLDSAEAERFDAARVVAASVEGYRSAYAPRTFSYDGPAADVWLHGVPDALAQLLDKLVENANDFAPAGTAVALALQQRGRTVELRVENEGPAIPPPSLIRLFDSMVTLRSAAGEGAHLGLGLYIVRLIAEFHGGRARAENLEGGRGVRFTVTLPAAR